MQHCTFFVPYFIVYIEYLLHYKVITFSFIIKYKLNVFVYTIDVSLMHFYTYINSYDTRVLETWQMSIPLW